MSRDSPHKTLNLGILAHVDAGKTTLTERRILKYEFSPLYAGQSDAQGAVETADYRPPRTKARTRTVTRPRADGHGRTRVGG